MAEIAISSRLEVLNSKLGTKMRFLSAEGFQVIIATYEMLLMAQKLIDNHLTLQLVPVFGFLIATTSFSIYSFISYYLKSSLSLFDIFYNISHIFWILMELSFLVAAIFAAETVLKSVNKLFSIEYEMKKLTRNEKLIEKFSSLIKLIEKVNFEPQTIFFKLNWKLLMMVSAI
jgi:hypothetical protein